MSVCQRIQENLNNSPHSWQKHEVKTMFSLLQSEYENSKRYNVREQYKELERIIKMFTADEVIDKVHWLGSEENLEDVSDKEEEEDVGATNTHNGADNDDLESELSSGINWYLGNQKIKSLVTSLKMASLFFNKTVDIAEDALSSDADSSTSPESLPYPSSPFTNSSSISSSLATTSSSSSYLPTTSTNSTSMPCQNSRLSKTTSRSSLSPPRKFPRSSSSTTCKGHLSTPDLTTSKSSPTFRKQEYLCPKRSFSVSSNVTLNTSTSNLDNQIRNTQQLPAKRYPAISKEEIPEFQIPSLNNITRNANPSTEIGNIDPSLYSAPNNDQLPARKSALRKLLRSKTTPFKLNISKQKCDKDENVDNEIVDNTLSSMIITRHCSSDPSIMLNFESEESASSQALDIADAHAYLLNMKASFDKMSNWNVVSRHRTMKKLLKSCNKFNDEHVQ